ncbi:MAG: MFS transporter [Clostridia bacterium BRH_c25]|nr:MAG: MFS transporter [Clostridia bacterium BRH_c25]
MNSNRNKVVEFFGLNKSMGAMLVMVILIGLGEKMAERFLPLYLVAIGGSIYAVGFLNAMDNLLSALYSFPGGYITDKVGYKKALMIFTLISLFGYAIVILIPTWQAVLVGSVFFIAWTAISLPAIMSMVSKTARKEKRTMGVSVHSLVRRIPMALGPVIGGVLIALYGKISGIRIAFGVAFILGLAALFFQYYFMEDDKPAKDPKPVSFRNALEYFSPSLRNLLVSDILIRFAEQIPYAFVVIWVVENNGLSPLQFGILTTIEMVTALLVYIPVAYMADKYGKKPFVLITFGFFTLFPLILYFSRSFWVFVLAFIIRGLKEFGEPTRKALIMDLAPEDAKARTFGTYYLLRDIVVSTAALSSAYLWNISPQVNFLTAFAFGLIGMIWFAIFGRDLQLNK